MTLEQQDITRNTQFKIGHWFELILFVLLSFVQSIVNAQVDTAYAFIVAGHAYGSHDGGNLGLHPALLNRLNSGFDPNTAFMIFTGDIVNQSTSESWQQVEDELTSYALPYYYVMGNHDANAVGWQVFENKFGGTFYTFRSQTELFIVLNSTEEQRSISSGQLEFLQTQIDLAGDTLQNIFIFFHEVLWNSNEKYLGVRSNSRSRYDQIVNYSNYWEEVHLKLLAKSEKNFYVITGDVGGNPDAIAAFYDKWDNIVLISSGMGEVFDENYLLVHVFSKDSVEFELVPLNSTLNLDEIEYYSVPPATGNITGPLTVQKGSMGIEYSVPWVFNADSYLWELPKGATGSSTMNSIEIDFNLDFTGDSLSVRAARDGYGTGPSSSMMIESDISPIESNEYNMNSLQVDVFKTTDYYSIEIRCNADEMLNIQLFDANGRILRSEKIRTLNGYTELQLFANENSNGIFFISVSTSTQQIVKKYVSRY